MAKKKKNSQLSNKERLECALIPNWDEPYKLPDNWCWVKLGSVCSLGNGIKHDNEDLVYLDVKTLRGFSEQQTRNSGVIVEKNQTIILVDGENSGEVFVVPFRGYMGSTFKTISISQNVDEMYIRYFIDLNREKLRKNKTGSAIPHLNKELFFGLELPLPPFYEQKRIVEKIDSLFIKLDDAKEKVREVLEGVEMRKASILHKAFSGELTVKWREENFVSVDSWTNKSFEDCVDKMQNGLAKRSGKKGSPYVVLRLANLSDDEIITDDLREIVLDSKEQAAYKLNVDDVVMIRVNGSKDNVAKQILVTKNNKWAFCDHIIRIRYNESVLAQYMVLFSKSETYRHYVINNMVSSAGQNTISRKGMVNLEVPVPTIDEQKEIVSILSNFLAKEQAIKIGAENVIKQIETMKKSILSKAFRGELGTNDSTEESAMELLKQVISGNALMPNKVKSVSKRVSIPFEIKQLLASISEEEIIQLLIKSDSESISIEKIMSLSSKKFELMDALRTLEKKNLIIKNEEGKYLLKR